MVWVRYDDLGEPVWRRLRGVDRAILLENSDEDVGELGEDEADDRLEPVFLVLLNGELFKLSCQVGDEVIFAVVGIVRLGLLGGDQPWQIILLLVGFRGSRFPL